MSIIILEIGNRVLPFMGRCIKVKEFGVRSPALSQKRFDLCSDIIPIGQEAMLISVWFQEFAILYSSFYGIEVVDKY